MGGSGSKAAKRTLPKVEPLVSRGRVDPNRPKVFRPPQVTDALGGGGFHDKDNEFVENMFQKLSGSIHGTQVAVTRPDQDPEHTTHRSGPREGGVNQQDLKELYHLHLMDGRAVTELAARFEVDPQALQNAMIYTRVPIIQDHAVEAGSIKWAGWPERVRKGAIDSFDPTQSP